MVTTTPARRTTGPEGRPAASRMLVALTAIIALVAVGLMSLFATPASASTLTRPQNAVGVIAHQAGQRVGAHEDIPAGQGRARAPNYDQTVVGSGVGAEDAGAASRGLSRYGGIFSSEENAAGGTVWTSQGDISQNDFSSIVNSSLMKGEGDVNIISGVHGELQADGSLSMRAEAELYQDDVQAFGNLPGVNVYNLPDLTPAEISELLNGPGTTIGGFCNSGACLAPFK